MDWTSFPESDPVLANILLKESADAFEKLIQFQMNGWRCSFPLNKVNVLVQIEAFVTSSF